MVYDDREAAVDAAGAGDRRGVDGALHSRGAIGAFGVEPSGRRAGAARGGDALCVERGGERFVELGVLFPAPCWRCDLGVPVPRPYDRAPDLAHRAAFATRRVAPRAIRRLGHVCLVFELSRVGDE